MQVASIRKLETVGVESAQAQAIVDVIEAEVAVMLKPLATREDVGLKHADLKTEFRELKADFKELKSDVSELKSDMIELKSDIKLLRSEMAARFRSVRDEVKADIANVSASMMRYMLTSVLITVSAAAACVVALHVH